jgi:hypothetical protein
MQIPAAGTATVQYGVLTYLYYRHSAAAVTVIQHRSSDRLVVTLSPVLSLGFVLRYGVLCTCRSSSSGASVSRLRGCSQRQVQKKWESVSTRGI